jgi:predicted GIY-YIG superfamily endonuclease
LRAIDRQVEAKQSRPAGRQGFHPSGERRDLPRRAYEHRNKLVPGFTSKYNVSRLVYYEATEE